MKRAEKKTTTLENSATKAEKPASAKTYKLESRAAFKKKPVTVAEKPLKKLKVESSAMVSSPASKTKKPVPVKVIKQEKSFSAKTSKQEKPAVLKKKIALTTEKVVKKLKPAADSVKVSVSTPKVKKTVAANSTVKPKKEKMASTVSAKNSKPKKEQILLKATGKKVKTVEKKAKILTTPIKLKLDKSVKAAGKSVAKKTEKKTEIVIPATNSKSVERIKAVKKAEIIIPAITSKPGKKAATAGKKIEKKAERKHTGQIEIVSPKTNSRTNKKAGTAEKKVEIVIPPITAKPVKKKIKPIGSAVVRGKNGRYDFEVFPLDADLKDGSAIYVISKRITDKRGRGHHKFVCIGQTESLIGEIKKHKKDKCIKQHKANVICLLREESAANRLKIETDLREAHTIACNQK